VRDGIARLLAALATLTVQAWRFAAGRAAANADDLARARFGGALVVVPLLSLFAAALLLNEHVVISTYVVDYALPLDTGLRWLHGQIPHLDYHTPIGAAYWLFQGLAVELIGLDARSPIVANFLAAAVLVGCGLPLLRARLAPGFVGVMAFAVVLMMISPRSVGDPPGQVSFLGAYNKMAIAGMILLLAILFLERRQAASRLATAGEAVLAAMLLVLLFYAKLPFAAVVVAGGIVSLYYAPTNRRLCVWALPIAALAVAMIAVGLGIGQAYLSDLAQASASVDMFRPRKALGDVIEGIPLLAVVVLAVVTYWRRAEATRREKVSNGVLVAGLMAASLLAMNQVHDHAWPMAFAILIILAQRALDDGGRAHIGPTLGALALVAYMLFADTISILVFATGQRNEAVLAYCDDPERPLCRLKLANFKPHIAVRLSPMSETSDKPPPPPRSLSALYRQCDSDEHCIWWKMQEDLMRHLNRHVRPQDRPLYLGFMNVLPYHYGLEPPRGLLAWMDVDRNLSLAAHPEPQAMLDDVTLVVVPHMMQDMGYFPELMTIYGPAIRESFTAVEQNDQWSIWRRGKDEKGPPADPAGGPS